MSSYETVYAIVSVLKHRRHDLRRHDNSDQYHYSVTRPLYWDSEVYAYFRIYNAGELSNCIGSLYNIHVVNYNKRMYVSGQWVIYRNGNPKMGKNNRI